MSIPSWVPIVGGQYAVVWLDFVNSQYWVAPNVVSFANVVQDPDPNNRGLLQLIGLGLAGSDYAPRGDWNIIMGSNPPGSYPGATPPPPNPAPFAFPNLPPSLVVDTMNNLITGNGGFTLVWGGYSNNAVGGPNRGQFNYMNMVSECPNILDPGVPANGNSPQIIQLWANSLDHGVTYAPFWNGGFVDHFNFLPEEQHNGAYVISPGALHQLTLTLNNNTSSWAGGYNGSSVFSNAMPGAPTVANILNICFGSRLDGYYWASTPPPTYLDRQEGFQAMAYLAIFGPLPSEPPFPLPLAPPPTPGVSSFLQPPVPTPLPCTPCCRTEAPLCSPRGSFYQ